MSGAELVEMLDRFVVDLAAGRLEIPDTAEVSRRPRSNGGETVEVRGWTTGLGPMTVLTNADGQPTNASASLTEAVTLRRSDLPAHWGEGAIMVDDHGGSQWLSFDLEPTAERRHVVVSALLDDHDDDLIVKISAVPFQTET